MAPILLVWAFPFLCLLYCPCLLTRKTQFDLVRTCRNSFLISKIKIVPSVTVYCVVCTVTKSGYLTLEQVSLHLGRYLLLLSRLPLYHLSFCFQCTNSIFHLSCFPSLLKVKLYLDFIHFFPNSPYFSFVSTQFLKQNEERKPTNLSFTLACLSSFF